MFVKSGIEFEKFIAKVFAANGHHAAVTKGSGDYGVDLVLNGEIAVQAKFFGGVVGPGAVQEVVAGRAVYGCSQAWVVTNSTFTPAAVALAEANGVRLIAGDELQWLAENPDRSTDHAARYRAHLAELEAKELEAVEANRQAAEAERQAAEAKNLQRMAAWKDEFERKLAAGIKLSDAEQVLLDQAKRRILRDAGLPAADDQGSPLPGQSFRDLLARRAVRRETPSAQAANAPLGQPTSGPPPGWYPDPSGESEVRWWDGQEWTSTVG
ncbi:restriction endonuclease [Mycobacterium kansasii]